MGNESQGLARKQHDKSPASSKHLVDCFLNGIIISYELKLIKSPLIVDVVTSYLIYYDSLWFRRDSRLEFGPNRLRVTNIVHGFTANVLGRYRVDLSDSANYGKTFEWTFGLKPFSFVALGIADAHGTDGKPFYARKDLKGYFCSSSGEHWVNGMRRKLGDRNDSFVRGQNDEARIRMSLEVHTPQFKSHYGSEIDAYYNVLTVQDQRQTKHYANLTIDQNAIYSIALCLQSTHTVQTSVKLTDFMVVSS